MRTLIAKNPRSALTVLTVALTLGSILFSAPVGAWVDHPPVSKTRVGVKSLQDVDLQVMPRLDNQQLTAAAERKVRHLDTGPYVFAHRLDVGLSLDNAGTWETLADGARLWRLRIRSTYARHLNLAFERFELPEGAKLWIYDRTSVNVSGPYTAADRGPDGRLWTPLISGDEIVIELHVPANAAGLAELELGAVNHGFRSPTKQGSCNIDVVCPEGDPWRDQIRSEGWYTLQGIAVCSGQMINNTAQDGRPYFLTARHCFNSPFTLNDVASMVVYWNDESPTCGQLGGGSTADNQSGATLVSEHPQSDFTLVELDERPRPEYQVYYSGWDATGDIPPGVVGIHHPSTDEKSISFDNDPPTTSDLGNQGGPISWQVIWDVGTTEGGSSGSCIWDNSTGLCIGHLFGGFASCSNLEGEDFYGKMSESWTGGGTPQTRLQDWLDPSGQGIQILPGFDPDTGQTSCRPSATTLCLRNGRFQVDVEWRNGNIANAGLVAAPSTADSGLFFFDNPSNWEILVKVLDGCDFNDHFWVFASAATTADYTLTVTDTQSGETRTYIDDMLNFSPAITDTRAFATCP